MERRLVLLSTKMPLLRSCCLTIQSYRCSTKMMLQRSGVPCTNVEDSGPAGRYLCRAVGFIGFAPPALGRSSTCLSTKMPLLRSCCLTIQSYRCSTKMMLQWSGVPFTNVGDSGPAGRYLCRAVGFIGFAPPALGRCLMLLSTKEPLLRSCFLTIQSYRCSTKMMLQWSGVSCTNVGDSGPAGRHLCRAVVLLISPRWGYGKTFGAFIYKDAAATELLSYNPILPMLHKDDAPTEWCSLHQR